MERVPWFEYDKEALKVEESEFVDVLAARANSWLVDPLDTIVVPPAHTSGCGLIVCLDIVDRQGSQGLLTVGAHFKGANVHGDKLHNQNFSLPAKATEYTFTASGSSAELAEGTAAWL